MADETKNQEPDDSEPTPERQAELRAAYEANVAADSTPSATAALWTRWRAEPGAPLDLVAPS